MKLLDLNSFEDFNEREIARRILLDDPVRRMVLVSLRAGQGLPEHGTPGPVSVFVISGRVMFY
jgi:quercetin dioxygenase-like cupin family protein